MPAESEHFLCPCCGMHAPIERLYEEKPFVLQMFKKALRGKHKLSDEEREARKGGGFRRGSGHGALDYELIELTDEVRAQLRVRLEEILEGGV